MDGKIFARKSLLSFSAIVQPEKSDEYPGENKFEFSIRFAMLGGLILLPLQKCLICMSVG